MTIQPMNFTNTGDVGNAGSDATLTPQGGVDLSSQVSGTASSIIQNGPKQNSAGIGFIRRSVPLELGKDGETIQALNPDDIRYRDLSTKAGGGEVDAYLAGDDKYSNFDLQEDQRAKLINGLTNGDVGKIRSYLGERGLNLADMAELSLTQPDQQISFGSWGAKTTTPVDKVTLPDGREVSHADLKGMIDRVRAGTATKAEQSIVETIGINNVPTEMLVPAIGKQTEVLTTQKLGNLIAGYATVQPFTKLSKDMVDEHGIDAILNALPLSMLSTNLLPAGFKAGSAADFYQGMKQAYASNPDAFVDQLRENAVKAADGFQDKLRIYSELYNTSDAERLGVGLDLVNLGTDLGDALGSDYGYDFTEGDFENIGRTAQNIVANTNHEFGINDTTFSEKPDEESWKQIAGIVGMAAMFIPGLQPVAILANGALAVDAFKDGNIIGGLSYAAGALGGAAAIAPKLGASISTVSTLQNVAGLVQGGAAIAHGIKTKDWIGTATATLGMVSQYGQQFGLRAIDAHRAGVMAQHIGGANKLKSAIEDEDWLGAAGQLVGGISQNADLMELSYSEKLFLTRADGMLNVANEIQDAVEKKNWASAGAALADYLGWEDTGVFGLEPESQFFFMDVSSVLDAAGKAKEGDYSGIFDLGENYLTGTGMFAEGDYGSAETQDWLKETFGDSTIRKLGNSSEIATAIHAGDWDEAANLFGQSITGNEKFDASDWAKEAVLDWAKETFGFGKDDDKGEGKGDDKASGGDNADDLPPGLIDPGTPGSPFEQAIADKDYEKAANILGSIATGNKDFDGKAWLEEAFKKWAKGKFGIG
jgi:hypothetical protein